MSLCTICQKDSKQHTKRLLELHSRKAMMETLKQNCIFCNKGKDLHSEKLWEMHDTIVKNGVFYEGNALSDVGEKSSKWSGERAISPGMKHGKIYPMRIGIWARVRPGMVVDTTNDGRRPRPLVLPIEASCNQCGLLMGDKETDEMDVLDGLCLKCFCEQTEQEYTWHSTPLTFEQQQKKLKQAQKKAMVVNI